MLICVRNVYAWGTPALKSGPPPRGPPLRLDDAYQKLSTGQPSLSLPLHIGASGMPVGVLFSAAYADEKTLFRLAAQIEHAAPWFDRVSPLLAQAMHS